MTDTSLDCIELDPPGPHSASVIWLHGLGASGNDFVPVVPHLGLAGDHGVRFVFPHAPQRPVTINMGMVMPAWYDIKELSVEGREDHDGVADSTARVRALIKAEQARGIPAERIVLAGFSQGGAIALHAGLGFDERLAGILALSTYLPLRDDLPAYRHAANNDVPIFMAHGQMDATLPFSLGEMSRDMLTAAGYAVDWHAYPMQHEVCLEEIAAVGRALNTWLSAH